MKTNVFLVKEEEFTTQLKRLLNVISAHQTLSVLLELNFDFPLLNSDHI